MRARTLAEALASGLSGASGGAQLGYKFGGGEGALIGGLGGGLAGALGGMADASAQEPYNQLNLQEQGLQNDTLQAQLETIRRKNRTDKTAENGMNLFRKFLGGGFSAGSPTSMLQAMNPYPGLGGQK